MVLNVADDEKWKMRPGSKLTIEEERWIKRGYHLGSDGMKLLIIGHLLEQLEIYKTSYEKYEDTQTQGYLLAINDMIKYLNSIT